MSLTQLTMKKMLGAVAVVSTLAVAGCGSAVDVSGAQGATLTKVTFASALTKATSQARSVHMVMVVGGQGQHISMTADEALNGTALKDSSMAMTMSIAGTGSVQMRVVSGVAYINTAALGLGQSATKPWIKFDLTDAGNPLGAMFSQMSGSMNPSALATSFKAMSTLVKVGTETVDGVQATHYQVTIDTAKLGTLLGLPAGGAGSTSMPKMLTYNVWVDASSRPVKIAMAIPQLSMVMHFSKWGEPVHVVVPPASQVQTYTH